MTNPNRLSRIDFLTSGEVRAEIARARASQTNLAQTTGISLTALGRKVRGEVAFTVGELSSLAKALGTSASRILQLAEESSKPQSQDKESLQ